jgi:hypothetical protein
LGEAIEDCKLAKGVTQELFGDFLFGRSTAGRIADCRIGVSGMQVDNVVGGL